MVPDWVCEVLSPSTSRRDRVEKRDIYARHRVPHYWLVDVDARTLEALFLEEGRWVLTGSYGEDATVAIPPFDAVELPVGRLFMPKRPE